ncbi:DUF4007 family protein [Deinococcus cellulosilyticus]|uniref:DUF4007 domain-containing protein n=1 Tax=Deinococcus cellulosilyticus (strain DSM 18568 / NBRC 106333 / KACC 11606 / 5516J-15) TaxID=1223518 RepID=A0A511N8N9_DEIC1|nr:DUF4007 family protein [Deinococcus cellulosilyticus]GEM49190.1 hypothetical protein DC3_48250 [Deinococcus cellulosilyticus NBRC 106333 = KACC 11606]
MLMTPLTRTSFSGHESFALRYSWLPKAVQGLEQQSHLFLLEDATTALGVGKNMVGSIRHWCTVMGLIQPVKGHKGLFEPTTLARLLLSEKGWDPYLEDPATLWLLHHLILQNPEEATLWHLLFTVFRTDTFTRQEVVSWVLDHLQHQGNSRANANSIERDFEVLIRTYLPALNPRGQVGEESFDSPLVELGLLRRLDRNTFTFIRGEHRSLPDAVFAYALLDYWQKNFPEISTVSLERFMYHPGAPGAAFKLTETAFLNRVEQVQDLTGIHFDDTAGMRSLIKSAAWPENILFTLLENHYTLEGALP